MKIILSVLLSLLFTVQALANEALFSGTAFSLVLDDAVIGNGGIAEEIIFTTYDGNLLALPLQYDSQNSTLYYSRELKKVDAIYRTDYYLLSDQYIDDYGAVHLDLGNIDNDGNGVDDICEKSKSFNGVISGEWFSFDGTSGNISGAMVKNAGLQSGSYNLTLYDTWVGDLTFSSDFYAGVVSGMIAYSVSDRSMTIDYITSFDYTSESNTLLQTTYEIVDQDHVRVNAVDFFPTTVFQRNGNTYAAEVMLPDGEEFTSWPDYQKWSLRIIDNNDADEDGIPDLSDKRDNRKKVCLTFLPLLLK